MQTRPFAKLIRPITFFAVVTGIFGLVAKSQETQQVKQDKPAVSLQIAAVLAKSGLAKSGLTKSGPIVVFIATNNTEKELLLNPPATNGSPLVIVKPDTKALTLAAGVSWNEPPTIKPHQTLTWSEDLYDVFNRYKLNETGLYRISWRAATSEPNTPHNAVYKSNEMLVMREKGTPAIDPSTGRPFDPETGKPIDPRTGKPFE